MAMRAFRTGPAGPAPGRNRWAGGAAVLAAAGLLVAGAEMFVPAARANAAAIVRLAPGTNLSTVRVRAGRTYELAPGSTYTGTLRVDAAGVTIQGSGPGPWPVITRHVSGSDIEVSGRGDTIRWLRLTGRGYSGKNGYILGIAVTGTDAAITDVRAYGNLYAGVFFEASATGGVLSGLTIDHCNALNPRRLSTGAFGVLLSGSHATVEGNTLDNQTTPSPVYGTDGSAVEVYRGRDNVIRGNTGANDVAFTELGGAGAVGNDYIGNTFAGPGAFLITRGSGDKVNGPVFRTSMTGNHVKGEVVSFAWRRGDGKLLTLAGNTVSVPRGVALWTDGGYVNGGGNDFTGAVVRHHG